MSQLRASDPSSRPDPVAGSGSAVPAPNPLREIFADLISYVLLFRAICGERPPAPSAVRERIDALLAEQERRVKAGGVSWDAYRLGLFAVLSWVDETILTSSWPYRNEWRHLMLSTFQTLNAGNEFFTRLEQIPPDAREIKEIYFLCLSLGFEGQFALGGNPEALRDYRRRLYQDVVRNTEVRPERIFPEAYSPPRAAARPPRRYLAVVWFALAMLAPALLFGVYWYLLHRQTANRLTQLGTPLAGTPDRVKTLVELLRARGIQAEQAARGVVITLPGVLFEVNSAQSSDEGQRQIKEVATALREYAPGLPVLVEGHASREPSTPEETNQRLSEERSTNVVAMLKEAGLRNERVTAKGFGSKSPVATNNTPDGRAQNRRVEIIVENAK
jgi:type VI secretion system protein ImpK